jgi:putative ABC transport system permease protein
MIDDLLPAGEIVGVVGDVRHRGFDADPAPTIYVSYQQHATSPTMYFLIRASTNLERLASDVRRELQPIDPNQVVFNVRLLRDFLSESTAQRRFNMLFGIYGVMSYAVTQRTHEIGVRIALGARPSDALKLIIRQGMTPALIGVGIGLLVSVGLTRLMANLLFEVSASGPATFVLIALSLASVALLACYIPARRVTKVKPMIALRCE